MATVADSSPSPHSPPGPTVRRPKGILKNSYQHSPPVSPAPAASTPEVDPSLTEKEITIQNTQYNAGHRRSSSAARPPGSRRPSSRTPSHQGDDETSQRLKWDEANLYLTEQERTATMKIDEPKTPYVKHYDSPDEEDDDGAGGDVSMGGTGARGEDDIPGLSLGEPEEAVPEGEFDAPGGSGSEAGRKTPRAVHVDDAGSLHGNDADELAGLSAEEREKHRKFELMRKKHYEMKNVAHLLGHPEDLDELVEEGAADEGRSSSNGAAAPPVPPVPRDA